MPLPTPTDWLSDPEQVERFKARMKAGGMPRRHFVALMSALGAAAAAAACGSTTPTATTAPASSAPASSAAASSAAASSAAASSAAASSAAASSAAASASARPSTAASAAASSAAGSAAASSAAGSAAAASGSTALKQWPTGAAPTDLAADQTMNRYTNNDPSEFDINKNLYGGGFSGIYEQLLRYDPDFSLCAGDAVSYAVSNNGATYTFKMNPAAVWSNGDKITPETYIYSFTRQLDPATAAAYAGFLIDIKGAEAFNTKQAGATAAGLGLKAIDATTLEVTLERPAGYFPVLVAYKSAVPAHKPSVDKFGDKWTEPDQTGAPIVTNGMFVLTKWERGKAYTVERNERYATGPKPYLKTQIFTVIPTSAGLAPYEGGNLDYLAFGNIPAGEIPRLQADPNLSKQLNRVSQSGLWYLVPEVDKPPFDNLNVRKAIQKAVNREQLGRVIQGLGEPAYSLMPPDLPYYFDPAKVPAFKTAVNYNPDEAKKLLDGTPYAGGKNWPKIMMNMRDEGSTPRTAAEFIQKSLSDNLGMNVEFDVRPNSSAFTQPMYARQYHLIFIRWYVDYPDPNNFYGDVFYSRKTSGKRQAWSNSKFDDTVRQAGSEPDPVKRSQLYQDCEKILLIDEAAYSPLYYGFAYVLYKARIGGIPKTSAGITQFEGNIFGDMTRSVYIKK